MTIFQYNTFALKQGQGGMGQSHPKWNFMFDNLIFLAKLDDAVEGESGSLGIEPRDWVTQTLATTSVGVSPDQPAPEWRPSSHGFGKLRLANDNSSGGGSTPSLVQWGPFFDNGHFPMGGGNRPELTIAMTFRYVGKAAGFYPLLSFEHWIANTIRMELLMDTTIRGNFTWRVTSPGQGTFEDVFNPTVFPQFGMEDHLTGVVLTWSSIEGAKMNIGAQTLTSPTTNTKVNGWDCNKLLIGNSTGKANASGASGEFGHIAILNRRWSDEEMNLYCTNPNEWLEPSPFWHALQDVEPPIPDAIRGMRGEARTLGAIDAEIAARVAIDADVKTVGAVDSKKIKVRPAQGWRDE